MRLWYTPATLEMLENKIWEALTEKMLEEYKSKADFNKGFSAGLDYAIDRVHEIFEEEKK